MGGWLFLSFVGLGSLIGLTGIRQLLLEPLPSPGFNVVWFGLQVLPLLVCLPSLLRGEVIGTFLLSLLSLLYVVHGVMLAFEGTWLALGLIEVFFALGLCGSTAVLVRKLREADPTRWGKD